MSEPKAKWKRYSDGDWCADIGSYSVNAAPDRGAWWVDSAEGELASDEKPGPCDVVTLMLAAESALATHLRAVADTMTWPEVEREESPGKISLTVTTTDGAKVAAQAAAIGDAFAKALALSPPPPPEAPRVRSPFIIGTCRLAPPPPEYQELTPVHVSPAPPMYKIENGGPTAIYVPPGDGEVISNTGESAIYVRGMRIAPGHQISRRKDGGVEARCIACGSLSVWCQCTFANNKKPPTPEGTGGGR